MVRYFLCRLQCFLRRGESVNDKLVRVERIVFVVHWQNAVMTGGSLHNCSRWISVSLTFASSETRILHHKSHASWARMPFIMSPAISGIELAQQLAQVRTEVRDLQRTVESLRHALEAAHVEKDHAVRAAETIAGQEAAQLKVAVAALRDELEHAQILREQEVQRAQAAGQDEIHQLRTTVAALRDELEHAGIEQQTQVQAALAASANETAQLKATAGALREQLEMMRARQEQAVQDERLAAEQEKQQLRDTIQAMRDAMDEGRKA